MKTTFKELPKSQAKVTISMPAQIVQKHVDAVVSRHAKHVEVPGFRKGHAPTKMVINHLGLGRLQQETLDLALQEGYVHALGEHKFHPISQPAVGLKKFTLTPEGIVSDDLEYELTIDLMPKVEFGDYTHLTVDTKLLNEKIDVSDKEVDTIIEHLRRQKSTMEDVNRPVKKGDWVEISFTGTIDNVVQEKLASQHHPLVVGSGVMVPGFEEALIGMKSEDKKKQEITFPKDYFSKEFAGRKAEFTITLHKVKLINLPEINEAFVRGYGHSTMDDLTKAIKKQLVDEKKERQLEKIRTNVLEQARKLLKVEIPAGLLHQEIDRLIASTRESIEKQGVAFNQYLESIKKTSDDLHKELEPQAKANIEIGLLLGEVIKREKLDPEDKEAPKKAMERLVAIAKKNSKLKL